MIHIMIIIVVGRGSYVKIWFMKGTLIDGQDFNRNRKTLLDKNVIDIKLKVKIL